MEEIIIDEVDAGILLYAIDKTNISNDFSDKFYLKYKKSISDYLYEWWTKYSDRKFMLTLYPKISEYLIKNNKHNLLDIGAMEYNVICRKLVDEKIEYIQIEPNIEPYYPKNNLLLNCDIQSVNLMYPEFKYYFSVIIDFGVLGAPSISGNWDDKCIEKYIANILFLLEDKGIYILKIDRGYFESNKIENDKYLFPYFNLIKFDKFSESILVKRKKTNRRAQFTDRDQYKFYFLQKK